MNILVGMRSPRSDFSEIMKEKLCSMNLDVGQVIVKNLKSAVEETVRNDNSIDAVIIAEFLEPESPYKVKEVERLMSVNETRPIILLLNKKHKGDSYMNQLYANGFYTALYEDDAGWDNIVNLIKNGRRRKLAKAYYGVTTAEVVTDKAVSNVTKQNHSPGEWADIVTSTESYEDKLSYLRNAQEDLDDTGFKKLISYLPNELCEQIAKIKKFKAYFPEKENSEESGAEASVVRARKIIGVVSLRRNPKAGTILAMNLAKAVYDVVGVECTFLQLGAASQESSAYEILGLKNKCPDFHSHMQDVLAGNVISSDVKNNVDGVSVICPNPSVDWESWSSENCLRLLQNISGTVIVDLGNDKSNLSRCDEIIVVVPEGESASLCIRELVKEIGEEKPIKAVSSDIAKVDGISEIAFPQLYTEQFKYGYPGEYIDEMHHILRSLGYIKNDNDEDLKDVQKSAFIKGRKKKRIGVFPAQGMQEIAVCGSKSGAGCSYDVFAIAAAIGKKYRVAVLDLTENKVSRCLGDLYKCKLYVVDGLPMFRYKGVDFFYRATYSEFFGLFAGSDLYDFVVIDYGTDFYNENFARANTKVCAIMPGIWNCDSVYEFSNKYREKFTQDNSTWLVAGGLTKELAEYKRMFGQKNIFGLPYSNSPFDVSADTLAVLSRAVKIPLG